MKTGKFGNKTEQKNHFKCIFAQADITDDITAVINISHCAQFVQTQSGSEIYIFIVCQNLTLQCKPVVVVVNQRLSKRQGQNGSTAQYQNNYTQHRNMTINLYVN